ncbi:Hypothetical predicted protein, partial [Mytilus galloprovincialis]
DSIRNPPSVPHYQMNGMEFTTSDRDNDKHLFLNVGEQKRSGWWFNWATDANLNGISTQEGIRLLVEYTGTLDNPQSIPLKAYQ